MCHISIIIIVVAVSLCLTHPSLPPSFQSVKEDSNILRTLFCSRSLLIKEEFKLAAVVKCLVMGECCVSVN